MKILIDKRITFAAMLFCAFFVYCTPVHASSIIKPPNNLSLVGYWSFDEGTSTVAHDFSGNRNNGPLTGSPTWVSGKFGTALKFTSSGQYVATGYTIPAQNSATSFTWSVWINQTSSGGSQVILGFRNGATWMKLTPSSFEYNSGGIISNTLPINRWTFVTIVKSGSNFTYYEDGAVVGTASNSSSVVSQTFYIANDPGFNDGAPHYTLDDIRVYNRALSVAEITGLYLKGKTRVNTSGTSINAGSTLGKGLVGYWTMDGADTNWTSGTAGVEYDRSGNGNIGTLTSMNRSTTPVLGKAGQALKFDGSSQYIDVGNSSTLTSNTYTVAFWVKLDPSASASSYQGAVSINDGTATKRVNFIARTIDTGNKVEYWDSVTGTKYSSHVIPFNTWVHLAFVIVGNSNISFYINGSLDSSQAVVGNLPSVNHVWMGRTNTSGENMKGNLDDVRIYNRALSATEIAQLYQREASSTTNASSQLRTSGSSLATGLVSLWTFDGKDVTDKVYDRVGGNNGYVGGGVATSSMEVIGKLGQALNFNGTTYVNAGSPSSLINITNAITVSVWVKRSVAGALAGLMGTYGSSDAGYNLTFGIGNANNDKFCFTLQGISNQCSSGTYPDTNQWHLLTATYDRSNVRLYYDGVNTDTFSQTAAMTTANGTFSIGRRTPRSGTCASGCPFNGRLDDARVYNRALSAAEVKQLYNLGK